MAGAGQLAHALAACYSSDKGFADCWHLPTLMPWT